MAFRINHLRSPFTQAVTILKHQSSPKIAQRNGFHSLPRRNFSSGYTGKTFGFRRSSAGLYAAITAAGIGGGYLLWNNQGGSFEAENAAEASKPRYCPKYQRVYNAIAKLIEDPEYEEGDGSYGPIFVRLAWHASGTYCLLMNNGGSYKATMRFEPESKHEANRGLQVARDRLEEIKVQFPWVSYGDIWTLAGVCGVQEMGGPQIPWRPGRIDGCPEDCPPDGRLPDGTKGTPQHPREIFYRMGFNDQEIVALVGAHTLGRCHEDRSGFDGRWTESTTSFSNLFFVDLLGKKWVERKWRGNKQFQDEETGELMMLPTDMAFLQDCKFKKWVNIYAKDEKRFFQDFARAYQKLVELGVPYPPNRQEFIFKTLEQQEES